MVPLGLETARPVGAAGKYVSKVARLGALLNGRERCKPGEGETDRELEDAGFVFELQADEVGQRRDESFFYVKPLVGQALPHLRGAKTQSAEEAEA